MPEISETHHRLGIYRAICTRRAEHVARAQCFRSKLFGRNVALDADAYDDRCWHVLIEHEASGELLCTFRMLPLECREISTAYSAQFYDVSALSCTAGRALEIGRFCALATKQAPDILRLALALIADTVEGTKAQLLFGCTSFSGVHPENFAASFALLANRYLAPQPLMPLATASETVRLADFAPVTQAQDRMALQQTPGLLRSYLALGGWVSDRAVVDRQMNTMHVFTGLETARMPLARKNTLRATAMRMVKQPE